MTNRTRAGRNRLQRAMGGARNAVRAEQMRAVGLSDRSIARTLGVSADAVARWFELQDELAVSDVDGAA